MVLKQYKGFGGSQVLLFLKLLNLTWKKLVSGAQSEPFIHVLDSLDLKQLFP